MSARVRRTARRLALVTGIAVLALAIGTFAWDRSDPSPLPDDIPTAVARTGDVAVEVHAIAESRAARAALLSAGGIPGTLQIVEMVATGARVRAGDPVVRFDPVEQQYQLEQSRSELAQAEEDLQKLNSDTTVKEAQHAIEIMKARFALRRAELDLRSNDLVGKIQMEKNRLAFEEATRLLAQLESDAVTLTADATASRAALEEKRNKSRFDVEAATRSIDRMTLTAPFDGIAIAQENRDAAGGFMIFGMTMPEYRTGDVVQPGRPVAEVFDPGSLEMVARIAEADASNVSPGQKASVTFYPQPGRTLNAKVSRVGGGGARRFWEASSRQLEVVLHAEGGVRGIQPGWSGTVVIHGEPVRDATHVPRQALVEKDGRSVVYVRQAGRFVATPVKVQRRTEISVVVEGLAGGAEVALRNPEAEKAPAPSARTAAPAGLPR
jgi:multidrug efflux pump subunit AcrA (membrane-fusion protein)